MPSGIEKGIRRPGTSRLRLAIPNRAEEIFALTLERELRQVKEQQDALELRSADETWHNSALEASDGELSRRTERTFVASESCTYSPELELEIAGDPIGPTIALHPQNRCDACHKAEQMCEIPLRNPGGLLCTRCERHYGREDDPCIWHEDAIANIQRMFNDQGYLSRGVQNLRASFKKDRSSATQRPGFGAN